jgi:hypothetical protein
MKERPIATPEKIALDLAACKTAFDEVGIPWVITGGIVLGYARYNAIMEWDTDLDVGVFVKISGEQWAKIFKALYKNGFKINTTQEDFKVGRREAMFNLEVFHKNGEYYESFPKTTPGLKFVEKAKWYDKPQIIEFLGNKYPMPNHLEDFLDAHYGKDWKTNIIKDHSQYFREKRGDPRNVNSWLLNRKRKEDGNLWWPAFLKIDENIGDFNEI